MQSYKIFLDLRMRCSVTMYGIKYLKQKKYSVGIIFDFKSPNLNIVVLLTIQRIGSASFGFFLLKNE